MKVQLAVLLLLFALSANAATTHGKIAGTISKKIDPRKEIVIHCADTKVPILAGSKLYLMIDDAVIQLDVTFPMISSVTCRLSPKHAARYNDIQLGTPVFFGAGPITIIEQKVPKHGDVVTVAGIRMISLNGGIFMMGGDDADTDSQINEKPIHRVEVSPFMASATEITQEQYMPITGKNPSSFKGDGSHPVENISWYDAVEFCNALSIKAHLRPVYRIDKTRKDSNNTNSTDPDKWIITADIYADGFRIPTEAEWEFACRAGTSTSFFTGSSADKDSSWFDKNSKDKTHPAAEKKPNPFGFFDITGNVWEWCWDWYDDAYFRTSPEKNPQGPAAGSEKILRGASWINSRENLRSSSRNWTAPSDKSSNCGLRVVLPMQSIKK